MKCVVCQRRKGKRFCPAKQRQICAVCCGEKRVLEIRCPSDCQYLISGQAHQVLRKYVDQLTREHDVLKRRRFYEVTVQLGDVLSAMEAEIVTFAAGVRALRDRDVAEAVGLLMKTYETEKKGVIYEHTSANLLIQPLTRNLKALLDRLTTDPPEGAPRIRLTEILDCLEVMTLNIKYHLEIEPESDGYLKFIKRSHPDASSDRGQEGLLLEGLL